MIMSSGGSNSMDANLKPKDPNDAKSEARPEDKIIGEILQALKGLQFGEVVVTIRDGRVVQIDRIARNRQVLPKRS